MDDVSHHLAPARAARLARGAGVLLVAVAVGAFGAWQYGDAALATASGWADRAGLEMRTLLLGPVRVGVQIGHLHAPDHPEEHARLRVSTGGEAHGWTELEINLAVADVLADILAEHGVAVDLLPASVPPRYRADVLVSLHADSSDDPERRGYKSAHFEPARTPQERALKALVDRSYLAATALPDDHENVSGNMLWYYAFDPRYHHSVAPVTPSLLVEMGYISNRSDLAVLTRPEVPAAAIAEGLIAYLREAGRLPAP